jgi:hypothetical protein
MLVRRDALMLNGLALSELPHLKNLAGLKHWFRGVVVGEQMSSSQREPTQAKSRQFFGTAGRRRGF